MKFGRKGQSGIINRVIYGALGLAVLFLVIPTIVLPYFNTTYNYTVTGLSTATSQGIFLIILIVALIGFVVYFIPKIGKKV